MHFFFSPFVSWILFYVYFRDITWNRLLSSTDSSRRGAHRKFLPRSLLISELKLRSKYVLCIRRYEAKGWYFIKPFYSRSNFFSKSQCQNQCSGSEGLSRFSQQTARKFATLRLRKRFSSRKPELAITEDFLSLHNPPPPFPSSFNLCLSRHQIMWDKWVQLRNIYSLVLFYYYINIYLISCSKLYKLEYFKCKIYGGIFIINAYWLLLTIKKYIIYLISVFNSTTAVSLSHIFFRIVGLNCI